jgi:signal transduction histidine kinase
MESRNALFTGRVSLLFRTRSPLEARASALSADFFLQLLAVFLAYFVAGRLGQATSNIRSGNLGPVWPAYGVALASVLACGYRVWPALAASAFLVAMEGSVSAVTAAGQAAGATLGAVTGAFVLWRIPRFDPSLSRLRDALAMIVLGAFGSSLVSSGVGVLSLYATGVQAYSGLASAWLVYWLGDATGVLLVTPIVFTLPRLVRTASRALALELAALFALLTAACFVVFGDWSILSVHLHVLAFIVLPFVMWGAIDFGIAGAALSVFWIAAIATVLTALGDGPFADSTTFTNAVMLDVFFIALSLSGLSLAAVIAEREREKDQRQTRQSESETNQRLIAAQEQERTRIARELHDDISQRLALLILDLNDDAGRRQGEMARVRADAMQIAADVQALSHRLHSSKLEVLGLARASKNFCEEFAAQQRIIVAFQDSGGLSGIPLPASLCLYRVLQEAVHNAAKHSGARTVNVHLRGTAADVRLTVHDGGRGFDVQTAMSSRGIGLVTMHERVNLAGGQFSIESGQDRGTTINARVPLEAPRPAGLPDVHGAMFRADAAEH